MQAIPRCFLFVSAVLVPRFIAARDSASTLSVLGDVQKPTRWSLEGLKAQFANQVQNAKFAAGKDKQPMMGTGIPLLPIIQAAVPKADQSIKRHGLKSLVILETRDSCQAFFSPEELTPTPGRGPQSFLVWDRDGKPLPDKRRLFVQCRRFMAGPDKYTGAPPLPCWMALNWQTS